MLTKPAISQTSVIKPRNLRLKLALAVTLASLATTPAVLAQLEEIVVTSTKRGETSLGETSFTVNVVGGQELAARQITNPEDLRTAVSGVYIDEGSSTPRISIRGVGVDNFQVQAENGVTTYVDGVIIQRTQAVLGAFLDLQQVEVLKGPQGSAFGRNATGGSINLITAKPEVGFSGKVSAGAGSFDRRKLGGVLNYGGDTFGVRVAAQWDEDDGYIENLVTGNDELGDRDNTLARIALSWTPNDSVSVDYSFSYSDYETNGPGLDYTNAAASELTAFLGSISPNPFTGGVGLTPIDGVTDVTGVINDDYEVINRSDPVTKREANLHILAVSWDMNWATLESITGYMDFESFWAADVSNPSGWVEGFVSSSTGFLAESDQFSQEFLLSGASEKLDWVVGLYYLEEDATDNTTFDFNAAALAPPPNTLPVGTFFVIDNGQDLTSFAVFADGKFNIRDTLRLNAGVRWTEDEKKAKGFTSAGFHRIFGPLFPGAPLDGIDVKDDVWTGQVGLEYDLNDDLFSYIRLAKGYKAGGINNNSGAAYDPEELVSVEAGVKGELTESVRFALSAFTSDYKDIQVFVPGPAGVPEILNAAEATITGLDAELDWAVSEAFSVDAQFTWLAEAEYDEFQALDLFTLQVEDFSGASLTRSPDFTGIFGANFHASSGERVDISARAEVYVTSDIAFSQLASVRPEGYLDQDGYELFNLFVTATIDDNLDIRFYGKNITDEFYISQATEGTAGFQTGGYGRPREYGVELTYHFGDN